MNIFYHVESVCSVHVLKAMVAGLTKVESLVTVL